MNPLAITQHFTLLSDAITTMKGNSDIQKKISDILLTSITLEVHALSEFLGASSRGEFGNDEMYKEAVEMSLFFCYWLIHHNEMNNIFDVKSKVTVLHILGVCNGF
jgi:hypothetical protein